MKSAFRNIAAVITVLLIMGILPALLNAQDAKKPAYQRPPAPLYGENWFFTRAEMKKIYEKEYEAGVRLKECVRTVNGKYMACWQGKHFELSANFIKHTLQHFEQMLAKGYAQYLFRLDASHCHLFVLEASFLEKYNPLSFDAMIQTLTADPNLGALYHNSEHLALRYPPITGKRDWVAEVLLRKRNVLGWFDGRPIELTFPTIDASPARFKANTASVPPGFRTLAAATFKAHKNGEFVIQSGGKKIRVDISFCDASYY